MQEDLSELFTWEHRDQVYRVRFADGKEYDLTDCYAAKDKDEPSHATASIVQIVKSDVTETMAPGTAIFFYLSEIIEVVDQSGSVRYRTA
jgi:hypothetical protein